MNSGLIEKLQKLSMAVTYAEAGEWDTAREFLTQSKPSTSLSWLQNHFAAAAFAEAGLQEEAVHIISGREYSRQRGHEIYDSLGIRGVHLSFGYVTVN